MVDCEQVTESEIQYERSTRGDGNRGRIGESFRLEPPTKVAYESHSSRRTSQPKASNFEPFRMFIATESQAKPFYTTQNRRGEQIRQHPTTSGESTRFSSALRWAPRVFSLGVKWQRFPRCLNRLITSFRHVSHRATDPVPSPPISARKIQVGSVPQLLVLVLGR